MTGRPDSVSRSLRRSTWVLIGLGAVVCLACVAFLEWQWSRIMAGERLVNELYQSSELLASGAVRELYRLEQNALKGGEPLRGALPYSFHTGVHRVSDAMRGLRETQNRFGGWGTDQALARAEEVHRRLLARWQGTEPGVVAESGIDAETSHLLELLRTRLVQLERLHAAQMSELNRRLTRDQDHRPQWLALFLVLVPGAGLLVAWRILKLISRNVDRQAESESELAEAQQIAGLGKWEWHPRRRTFSGSGQTWEILGLPRSDTPVQDRLQDDRIHPDDRLRVREAAQAAMEGRGTYALQYRVVRPDGDVRWVYGRAEVVNGPSGRPERMVGTLLDVTALKVSEMRLAENRALLMAINSSQSRYIEDGDPSSLFSKLLEDLLHLTDSDYGFIGEVEVGLEGMPVLRARAISDVSWSPETSRMLEEAGDNGLVFTNMNTLFGAVVTKQEVVLTNDPKNDPRSGGLPPGHPPLNAFLGIPLFASGELVGVIGIANRPGGYTRELVAFLEPFMATCGNLIHVMREHSLRQVAEAALRESEARLRALAENLREVFWVATPDSSRLLYVSPAYEEIFGQPVSVLYQDMQKVLERIHPEDRTRLAEALGRLHLGIDEVFRVVRPDGTQRWVQARSFPVAGGDGVLRQVVGITIDITAAREAESAERRHREELTRVTRLATLGEVASGIAHDLNQPLFAITNYARGSARRLDSGERSDELRDTLEKIAVQAERASEVIDHLRNLSRGEGVRMHPEQINEVVKTAVRLALGDGDPEGVPIKVSLANELPEVMADRVQLEQVVINLIRNSLEAVGTGKGKIAVRTAWNGNGSGNGKLQVTVTDSGPGIDETARLELFEPFFTTKSGGMGMGLAICRTIIQAHQGEIWGKNRKQGAEFGFSLPVIGEGE